MVNIIDYKVNLCYIKKDVLIMKPVDLVICSIRPTLVNSYLIKTIEVDLKHINYGLDRIKGYGKKARSNFNIDDIVLFFESLNN